MADQIKIKHLTGQDLTVDVVLYTDTRAAGFSDELQKSVDYNAVSYFITEYLKQHSYRLLESVAEHLAEELLTQIPQVDRVDVEVTRAGEPVSPAPVSAASEASPLISVAISRAWHSVDLSIGANAGERRSAIMNAVHSIEENPRNRRVTCSGVIESQAYNYTDQPKFLNVAVELQTLFTPRELLSYLRELESAAGRNPAERYGPRALDIDIIFYDDCILAQEDLVIPHPDMQNRMFVLGPLSEISPGRLHPVFKKSVMRMRRELEHRKEKERESKGTAS